MFSLGATAYELASTSRLPETGPDYAAIRASPQAPASLPLELGALVKALMDPDPRRRPTAMQILESEALNSMVTPPDPWPKARQNAISSPAPCLLRVHEKEREQGMCVSLHVRRRGDLIPGVYGSEREV